MLGNVEPRTMPQMCSKNLYGGKTAEDELDFCRSLDPAILLRVQVSQARIFSLRNHGRPLTAPIRFARDPLQVPTASATRFEQDSELISIPASESRRNHGSCRCLVHPGFSPTIARDLRGQRPHEPADPRVSRPARLAGKTSRPQRANDCGDLRSYAQHPAQVAEALRAPSQTAPAARSHPLHAASGKGCASGKRPALLGDARKPL